MNKTDVEIVMKSGSYVCDGPSITLITKDSLYSVGDINK